MKQGTLISLVENFKLTESRPNFNKLWDTLSSSDQMAVERAVQYAQSGDSIEDAVQRACMDVSEANSYSEYKDEDFYLEEPDFDKVLEYTTIFLKEAVRVNDTCKIK
jgi:uncharacterized FlgJ-related protein